MLPVWPLLRAMTSRLPARSRSARVLARSDVGSNQRPDHTQDVCMAPRAASRNRYGVRRNRRRVPNISCRHPSPDGTVSRGPTHLGPLRTEDSATDVTGTWLPRAFQELVVGGRSLKAGWQSPYHALLGVRLCVWRTAPAQAPRPPEPAKSPRACPRLAAGLRRRCAVRRRGVARLVERRSPKTGGRGFKSLRPCQNTQARQGVAGRIHANGRSGPGGHRPPGPPIKGSIDSQRRSV